MNGAKVPTNMAYSNSSMKSGSAPTGKMRGPYTPRSGAGAFGLKSVPTSLSGPNAGNLMIAKRLNVAGKYRGVARRRSMAVKAGAPRPGGYPSIRS
jgi:hypothetical protein